MTDTLDIGEGEAPGRPTGSDDLQSLGPTAFRTLLELGTAAVADTGDFDAAGDADAKVSDAAYDATGWDGDTTHAPSKNAVRDKVELLAPKASPALTGNPTAPTPSSGDNDTSIATTAFVHSEALLLAAGGASVSNAGNINSNVNTVAATGSTETLDTTTYAVHDCTMDQACTFTFSNPASSGKNTTFMLILRGAFTPTLPAAVKWADATAPTYSTPTIYVFTTIDGGTTWLGQSVGKAFA